MKKLNDNKSSNQEDIEMGSARMRYGIFCSCYAIARI